jgi:hypothetical protein
MVRIQLDNGYLDVKEGTAFPLNFQVGDIRDLTQRKGTFSKTITLSGTKNNNTLLNNYYDVNIKAGTFDINKITKCTILQNGIPIVTDALLQLVNVKKVQLTDAYEQGVEYEVLVRDSQAEFYTTITNKELTDLDFSDCNHDFDITAITDSWSHTQSDNYKYLMPFNDTNIYTVNHFKPAIYAKSYFDRIFSNAGFTYDWQSLASSHFDKLLIPYNGDVNNFDYTDYRVTAETIYLSSYSQPIIGRNSSFLFSVATWTETLDVQNLFNPTTGIYTAPFNSSLNQGQTYNFNFTYSYEILLDNTSGANAYLMQKNLNTNLLVNGKYRYALIFRVIKNGINAGVFTSAADTIIFDGAVSNPIPNGTTSILNASGTTTIPLPYNVTSSDTLQIQVGLFVAEQDQGTTPTWKNSNASSGSTNVQVNPQIDFSDLKVEITPSTNIQVIGGTQVVNEFIPQKIKQSDFVKAIFQMYNLYAYPDINNPYNLILVSRDEWYDAGAEKDWSSKLAKNQEQQLIFLPDLTNKKLKLTYKEDTDSPNKTYTQATSEIYGQIEYTFQNEYVKDTDVKEILFSPTPVNKTSFDAYLPMISGIAPNTNIRILYDAGLRSCQAFNIYEQGTTGVTGLTSYPQTGHFNDAITPTFDINFGVCDYYFYQTSVLTNNNLYNLYWRRTVNQINVGRLLSASFYLNEADIQTLKLNDKIRIDNSWWNINKIMDYNANEDVLTKVELISVDTEIDLADFKTRIVRPFDPNISAHGNSGVYVDNTFNSNVNLSDGNVVILGKGNTVTSGVNALIVGDNQNVVETGINTTNLRVTETINGQSVSEVLPTYKKYIAIISQTGTADPTVTVLENTIGDIVWTRSLVGVYYGTLTGAFTANKTSVNISGVYKGSAQGIRRNDNEVNVITTATLTITETDSLLDETYIEIRVYP